MPGISDTAYPRLKPSPSAKELDEVYTPNLFECGWVEQRTREPVPRIGLLVLLKTFQRLGYFVMVNEVPKPILQHVAQSTRSQMGWLPMTPVQSVGATCR